MDNLLETILLILKIAGLLVTAIAGLIGFMSKTDGDDVEPEQIASLLKRFNVRGKKLFWISVTSVAVAVAAQVTDVFYQRVQDKKETQT
jgi:flagellar biosynthesis protein FlhB